MAGGRQDVLGEQSVTSHDDGVQVQALQQGLCKQTLADWKDATADYVCTKMFDRKQFVSDDALVMGGNIQKLVSFELIISGKESQRLFWEEQEGMTTVRETVRKKWQAEHNAMKLAF
jgi:pullulanase/glycogen debranching enzyme